jgi:membrane-bound lytic murein transglycosylase B
MFGSWAGAMGQCQFMPSSFLKYAVDYDNDGKRDIWYTQADVFASIANYLSSEGWSGDPDNNFNVLLKWNRSRYFATAVLQVADNIGE